LEHVLGCLRGVPLPGTVSLLARDDDRPYVLGEDADLDAPELLGFVEEVHLPMLETLRLARVRTTGEEVLLAGSGDPLAASADPVAIAGFIEPHPLFPATPPHVDAAYGLVGLVRTVDHACRRLRYGVSTVPPGQLWGELGALLDQPLGDCEPLWIDGEGTVSVSGLAGPGSGQRRVSAIAAARWAGEPLTWRGFSSPGPKLRGTARRALDAARILIAPGGERPRPIGAPVGYLSQTPGGRARALYGAVHPVTGDQLLSTSIIELGAMGYGDHVLLGYLAASAPVTGHLGVSRVGVPWALRFGLTTGT
jgi:hypothetical protein